MLYKYEKHNKLFVVTKTNYGRKIIRRKLRIFYVILFFPGDGYSLRSGNLEVMYVTLWRFNLSFACTIPAKLNIIRCVNRICVSVLFTDIAAAHHSSAIQFKFNLLSLDLPVSFQWNKWTWIDFFVVFPMHGTKFICFLQTFLRVFVCSTYCRNCSVRETPAIDRRQPIIFFFYWRLDVKRAFFSFFFFYISFHWQRSRRIIHPKTFSLSLSRKWKTIYFVSHINSSIESRAKSVHGKITTRKKNRFKLWKVEVMRNRRSW